MQKPYWQAEQQSVRSGCQNQTRLLTRVAAPPSQPESSVNQSTDKPFSEVEDMASVTSTENPAEQSPASDSTSPRTSPQSQEAMVVPE